VLVTSRTLTLAPERLNLIILYYLIILSKLISFLPAFPAPGASEEPSLLSLLSFGRLAGEVRIPVVKVRGTNW